MHIRIGPIAAVLSVLLGTGSADGPPLSYSMLKTDKPHDAPSVVLCRGQLFASSNFSGITRIEPHEMRLVEVKDYPNVGIMHQLTTDGQMLYVAYFTEPCGEEGHHSVEPFACSPQPTHGILKVDPGDLSIVAQLPLEDRGVTGWPEGFVWHDGYLYEAAYGHRGKYPANVVKIEPGSMTFVGKTTLPDMEGCHGITSDGINLYALGVPPLTSPDYPDHYYKIDLDTMEILAKITFPEGLHHYGGNVFLASNGYLYTSPCFPEETGGALVKIEPRSFTIVDVLRFAGRHWLATEGRYVYLVEGDTVRAIDPDTMVEVGSSAPPFPRGISSLHFGYVAEDGELYLGFENVGLRGYVGKMETLSNRDTSAPVALTNVEASALEGVIGLRWEPAQDPESGILAYRIYRGEVGAGAELLVNVPAASTRYTDRGAIAGRTYVYEVAAIGGSGLEGPRASTGPVVNGASKVPAGTDFEIALPSSLLPGDASVRAAFTSPSGKQLSASGAYDRPGVWKVRFRPTELGSWHYAVSSTDIHMTKFGGFEVVAVQGRHRRSS